MELGLDTPETNKQLKVIDSGESSLLTRFYDWLQENGYWIAEIDRDFGEMYITSKSPEQLFADFFGIDLEKVEEERQQMLEELRSELRSDNDS